MQLCLEALLSQTQLQGWTACSNPASLLTIILSQIGGHHTLEDYQPRGREPDDEMQTYTWPDATLRELYLLVKEVHPQARRPTARLDFAFVYPDRKGRNVMRSVGTTCCYSSHTECILSRFSPMVMCRLVQYMQRGRARMTSSRSEASISRCL